MTDWRTHCFDYLGGIADETGASTNKPIPLANPAPDTGTAAAPADPLKIVYDDPAKPSIKLIYTNPAQTSPPGFRVKPTPDPTFVPRKGAFKPTGKPGEWTATIVLTVDVLTAEVQVFATEQLTKVKGAVPLASHNIWFQTADSPYDPPTVMTTPMPNVGGTIGEPYLTGAKFDALARKRKKVIRDYLTMVTPSIVDTPAFDHLMTKAAVDIAVADFESRVPPTRFTTCGSLPSFLSTKFNEPFRTHRRKIGGLIACFWAAHDEGTHTEEAPAWIVAEDEVDPQPGDIFLITSSGTTPEFIKGLVPIEASAYEEHLDNKQQYAKESFVALHVGVIVDTSPEVTTAGGLKMWVVAEAGQGGDQHKQECRYDLRLISSDANGYPLMEGRRIAGWVNIDNYTLWTA